MAGLMQTLAQAIETMIHPCEQIMSLLAAILRMFQNQFVSVSVPYLDDDGWGYIFATDDRFERRIFNDEAEALGHYKATTTGLSLGSPSISLRHLPVDVARQLKDKTDHDLYINTFMT
jgi:hypothetical protein